MTVGYVESDGTARCFYYEYTTHRVIEVKVEVAALTKRTAKP